MSRSSLIVVLAVAAAFVLLFVVSVPQVAPWGSGFTGFLFPIVALALYSVAITLMIALLVLVIKLIALVDTLNRRYRS